MAEWSTRVVFWAYFSLSSLRLTRVVKKDTVYLLFFIDIDFLNKSGFKKTQNINTNYRKKETYLDS